MFDPNDPKVKEVEGEIDNLHTSWLMFVDAENNGSNSHAHHPPALFLAALRLSETYSEHEFDIEQMDIPCLTTPRKMANFAATVFEWAQLAARNGVMSVNMTPCDCLEITDEDLQELIGDNNDGSGNRPNRG